ncbi:outer membrane protein [Pararhizobium sp. IMCC21322]|uniref:outer membrane protein n=1 Tax=Pararhizobium sp. IMCC21322 TaxID=3067903 RepID=UPI0027425A4E|nr:outer membrane beta-barrel protein [Pararhizobium sp. IMCC21322]
MFFRKMGFVGSALLLSGGLALAADLPQTVYVEPIEPAPLPPAGFYASLHAGYVMPGDVDGEIVFPAAPSTRNISVDVEDGYRFGGALGYDFNSMIGIEAEVSYFEMDVDSISVAGPAPGGVTAPTSGDASVLTLMGNVIVGQQYDRWRPYVGVGAGAARVDLDITIPALPNNLHDNDWAFAGQAFVGLDYSLTDTVSLGARYRYLHIASTDYADEAPDPVSIDSFGTHSIEAAVKVKFGG